MASDEDRDKGYVFRGDIGEYPEWKKYWTLMQNLSGKTPAQKVAELLKHLRGVAFATATSSINADDPATFFTSPSQVITALDALYGQAAAHASQQAYASLARLRQGGTGITEHNEKFVVLASRARCSEEAAIGLYRSSLNRALAQSLAVADGELKDLMQKAEVLAALQPVHASTPGPRRGNPRWTRGRAGEVRKSYQDMTPDEKREVDKNIECYNCGKKGHRARQCRAPRKARGRRAEQEEGPPDEVTWDLQPEN
jgi:hypothetical protein